MSYTALRFDPATKNLQLDTNLNKPKVIKNDEILVKVAYSGVCGTDLHIMHGQFPCKKSTFALGHEFSGVVEEIGSDVTHIKVGDHVAVDPNCGCGYCTFCTNASYHLCKNAVSTVGVSEDGGWAQYCVVPFRQVYRLPDSVPLDYGALTEPMSCVVHGWDRLGSVPNNSNILILGAGIIGNLWACLFHLNGHRNNVTISEPLEPRRRLVLALDLGYEITIPDDLAREGKQFDLVVDCSGSAAAMQQAFTWISPGGRMLVFGVSNPKATMAISPYDIMKKELSIIGALTNPFTFPKALSVLEMMGARYLDYGRLGIKTFGLSEYKDAMKDLEAGIIAKAIFNVESSFKK